MPSIKIHERSGWKNASNATLSGSESVGPFRGREGRPSPGATDLAPSWATSNFGRTDLRRTTNNFFLAYVLNKHHGYHDPSEIDFARPTQASSLHHNIERPLLQAVFRCRRLCHRAKKKGRCSCIGQRPRNAASGAQQSALRWVGWSVEMSLCVASV